MVRLHRKKFAGFFINDIGHDSWEIRQPGQTQSIFGTQIEVVIAKTPDITPQSVQILDHQSTCNVLVYHLRCQCAGHDISCVDKKDMVFLFPDDIYVMPSGFHATHPSFTLFKLFIDPMGVVRMEKNDSFRKERNDREEQKDENINKGLEFVHKNAYSTEKKIMSNGVIRSFVSFG